MEIKNKISIGVKRLRIFLALSLFFIFAIIKWDLKIGFIGALISGFYFLVMMKYIEVINFNGIELKVEYIQWLRKKNIIFDISKSEVKIEKTVGYMGAVFFSLIIYQNNKKVFQVDSNDGFNSYSFQEFAANLIEHTRKN